jgi:hypothetical protein
MRGKNMLEHKHVRKKMRPMVYVRKEVGKNE